jgi:hypothetical protein
MSRTSKDLALDKGIPPERIFVGFAPDPLNTRVVYWLPSAFMYRVDAEADFDGKVWEYRLVEKKRR